MSSRTSAPARGAVVLGVVVTLLATAFAGFTSAAQRDERFLASARVVRADVQAGLDALEAVTVGLRNDLMRDETVTVSGFERAVRLGNGEGLYEGLSALGFVRVVDTSDTNRFELAVRDELRAAGRDAIADSFVVHPETTHPDRFVVELVEPYEGNEAAAGFDLGTDATRRVAVEAARDRGEGAATEPLVLVQDQDLDGQIAPRSVLLVFPMYATGEVPVTAPGRRRHFSGMVSAVIQVRSVVRAATDPSQPVVVAIYDVGETAARPRATVTEDDRLYRSHPDDPRLLPGAEDEPLRVALDLDVGGRRWRMFVAAGEGYPTSSLWLLPLMVALTGLSMTAASAAALGSAESGRRRAERLVEARTGELRTLLANAPDPTVVVDADGVITYVSAQMEALLGHTPEELVGRNVDVLVPDDVRAHHGELRTGFIHAAGDARSMARTRDVRALHRDGHFVEVDVSLSPLPADPLGGVGVRVIASLRDVTERREAIRRALELDDQRRTFMRTVSHELRTPLTSIDGFVRVLRLLGDDVTSENRDDYLERIQRNTIGLQRLIEDIIDFNRMDRGGATANPVPGDLASVAHEVVAQLGPVLESHVVVVDAPEPAPAMLDETATTRVLSNLLVNAVRYSPHGSTIRVEVVGGPQPSVVISDEGPGIPVEDRERVFERFWRGSGEHVLRSSGTGIGLAVVAELTEAQGGTVTIDEAPGGGARVTVVFAPVALDEAAVAASRQAEE